jgi:hypothetical protein
MAQTIRRPPPDLVGGVEEYEVEKVLDSCRYGRGHKLQYLIKWEGYPDSDNQWVNWDDASGAEEAIQEFKKQNPKQEVHIKAGHVHHSTSSCSRIFSMSTSPSPTVHWNFDTPDTRDAWTAANAIDHTAAGHACYDCNNNVNDPTCSVLATHRSPSVSSDSDLYKEAVERMTTHRDVEEAEANFPVCDPTRLSDNSTRGLPVFDDPLLEDGGRGLAPGPVSPGEFDVGCSTCLLPPAHGTPYPTIITLGSEHGGSEYGNADIQCGKCLAPIDYCHCDILILPPRDTSDPNDNDDQLLTPIPNTGADKGKRPIRGYVVNDLT